MLDFGKIGFDGLRVGENFPKKVPSGTLSLVTLPFPSVGAIAVPILLKDPDEIKKVIAFLVWLVNQYVNRKMIIQSI